MIRKFIFLLLFTLGSLFSFSQITTSSISGNVKSTNGETLVGVTIQATHVPTGTQYFTVTNNAGNYVLPAVRVGGPYMINATFIGMGKQTVTDVNTSLGVSTNVDIIMKEEVNNLSEVIVLGNISNVFSTDRTGAAQQFTRRELQNIPIIGARSIDAITKYNSMSDGKSFNAQDSRMNNFTIDGSQFNNGFGLGSSAQAGGRTGSTAISLDAIEQLQVNIAPFDIRESGFTGAGINAVTRSGSNNFEGSVYMTTRDNSSKFVGNSAYGVPVTASKFDEKIYGFRLGGPIVKNKLFFFGNFETLKKTEPGTTWTSAGSPLTGSQPTRVQYNDLKGLSDFMKEKYDYVTGPWEGYSNINDSRKFLVRLDWNINDNHKLTARYVHHDSNAEINISNSQSAGAGNRTTIFNSMSYKNSGYIIMDNTRSAVLELNSKLTNSLYNKLIVGYDKQIEDRAYLSTMFPTIDIADGTSARVNYISVGFDPFTPSNKLNYGTFHITNNLTKVVGKHTLVGGLNFEKYRSNNLFYPASNGVYIFNSLSDFYTAANQSLANGGKPSTLAPYRFQLRYSALPGGAEPMQVLESTRFDFYAQDDWNVVKNLDITFGVRGAVINFGNTAIENPAVTKMTFANGEKFNTATLPKSKILWEPRFAFNYNLKGKGNTQLRGGTGIFTGRPPYVFISNQVGNNGVLTGFIDVSGSAAANYGFTSDPAKYFTPATPTLPSTFDLAFTDPNYKFPQVWKTNVALDQRLPFGLIGSVEYLYNKNLNAVHYYNANLDAPTGKFSGVDKRAMFARNDNGVRVNDNVSMGAVLTNNSDSYYDALTLKLERPYQKGFFGSFAYTVSNAKDYMSAGSIASGSWQSVRSVNGNNKPLLSNSDFLVPLRMVGLAGYRIEYGKKVGGATSVTIGYVGQKAGGFSYYVAGDLNGDRVNNNELIFIPEKATDIKFAALTVGTKTYTEVEQQAAFEAYINKDEYLKNNRGKYAERNGSFLPILNRFDLSLVQEFNVLVKNKKNTIQIRADILNVGNLVNNEWGVSQRATNPAILTYSSVNTSNEPVYKFATQKLQDGSTILLRDIYSRNSSVYDVWTAQLGLRYSF